MTASKPYDVIVIGGGHNGLVTAAYLGRAGLRTLVLEARPVLGGAAATEEVFPGFLFDTGASDAGLFLPAIAEDLDLADHGLQWFEPPALACALAPEGPALTLWRDLDRSREEIAAFSARDAERFPAYVDQIARFSRLLETMLVRTPPDPAGGLAIDQLAPWLNPALAWRRQGRREMMAFLRALTLSAAEWLEEWFESPALRGVLATSGVMGVFQGPMSAGTTFTLLYHSAGAGEHGFRASRYPRGGTGKLSRALAGAARRARAEIRSGTAVARILVEGENIGGVELASGEQIRARAVASSVDPRTTLLSLVGARNLPVREVRRAADVRLEGGVGKVNLALDGLPRFAGVNGLDALGGHIVVSPGVEYLERAYDDAKYGRISRNLSLDAVLPTLHDSTLAPPGKHILSVVVRFVPYRLGEGTREADRARDRLGDRVVETLAQYAPDLPDRILHRQVLTPLDYEREYLLAEGGAYHGQMTLDQLLFMRPIPGYGRYRGPLAGLYFCGAGAHPGGGLSGAPGYNASREILGDLT